MFSDEKKGRLLTPLNEDQAAAVTAGAVGLGIGVLGSLVVGKLVEDRANCGPLQHQAAGLLPGFLGALQDPRCRGARVQHSDAQYANSQSHYQSPQANFQVPATQFQYTPQEKFPSSSQYQSPHEPSFFTATSTPQIETQYQFTPGASKYVENTQTQFTEQDQYPELDSILNYKPEGQYPATVPILSSQYQGPEQFQASPAQHQESSHYQSSSHLQPLTEKGGSDFKGQKSTDRPSAAQFGFGLPARRPSGNPLSSETHLSNDAFLTFSPAGDRLQGSHATHANKILHTTSKDSFDLVPNPAIQPRTRAKTEILAESEEKSSVHFPGQHVRVPRQWNGQGAFQQTAPHKATVNDPIQESREGRSQNGFQQTGFQQTAPHKATVNDPIQESREGRSQSGFQQTAPHKATVDRPIAESSQREWPGIQGRTSSKSRLHARSLDIRAPPKVLDCAATSESHAQCSGQEDGTPCTKKCNQPDCLAAVCCSGCCKRWDPNADSQCGRKKIFEVEILDL